MSSSNNTYALCIGINFYPNLRKDRFSSLKGCVNDAKSLASYLQNTAKVPEANITLLTSTWAENRYSAVEDNTPRLANYANITNGLLKLAEKAKAGDRVIVTYSGHGGREWTLVPEWRGKTNGMDETLVPMDALQPGGLHVRDFELSYLLGKIAKKEGVKLLVVIDSCHSGGAFRDADPEEQEKIGLKARTIFKTLKKAQDRSKEENEMLRSQIENYKNRLPLGADPAKNTKGVSMTELQDHWNIMQDRTENIPAQQWMVKPLGYDIWTGCLAHELSWETEGAGRLTSALVDSLETMKIGRNLGEVSLAMLYRNVYDRVYEKHVTKGEELLQTPVLIGELQGGFLTAGIDHKPTVTGIPIHALPFRPELDNARAVDTIPKLILRAGTAHGVVKDSEYAVYLWNENLEAPRGANGVRVVVTDVGPIASKVSVIGSPTDMEIFKKVSEAQHQRQKDRMDAFYKDKRYYQEMSIPWPSGCQAVLISGPAAEAKKVALAGTGSSLPNPWNEGKKLYVRGTVPLLVVPEGTAGSTDFRISVGGGGKCEVSDGGSKLGQADNLELALQQIMQVAKFRVVKEIKTPEEQAGQSEWDSDDEGEVIKYFTLEQVKKSMFSRSNFTQLTVSGPPDPVKLHLSANIPVTTLQPEQATMQ